MKQGMALQDLSAEILRQRDAKADFITDTRKLFVHIDEQIEDDTKKLFQLPKLIIEGHGEYGMTKNMHHQLSERLKIPANYYEHMAKELPKLLATNINEWFYKRPEVRMVRTMDSDARAFLSDRYRPLDNHDLAEAAIPTLMERGARVHSCMITPEKLHIKAVIDAVETVIEPPPGKGIHPVRVQPGIVISNSEIGEGALQIQPAIHHLSCLNMAVWAKHALRQLHVGRNFGGRGNDGEGDVWKFLSDETKQLSDAAVWASVRDVVKGALSPDGPVYLDIVEQLRTARGNELPEDVPRAVERYAHNKSLSNGEHQGVLQWLMEGKDYTQFGLSQALTRFSQEIEDYQRATDFEELGGQVIALSRQDFSRLVN